MELEVCQSSLWAQARLHRIPNCLDLDVFRPVAAAEKSRLRQAAGIDPQAICLIFGAFAGESDPRKGGDLLVPIIEEVASLLARQESSPPVQLAVFGASTRSDRQSVGGIPVTSLGALRDEQDVARALQCADLLLLPSRQDNLPNAGLEASACGLPLVSFDVGGLPDIVEDDGNGYRVPAFDCASFAAAVVGLILNHGARENFGRRSRALAVRKFGPDRVARRHENIYREQLTKR
jgi:glycosyltransferase involved in cell wall biosynthesis